MAETRRDKRSNNGGFALIVIVLVVVAAIAIVGAMFYFMPKQSPSSLTTAVQSSPPSANGPISISNGADAAQWLTFQDDHYGYSFKYPPAWLLQTATDWDQYVVAQTTSTPDGGNIDNAIQFSISDSWQPSSEAEFFEAARQTLWGTCLGGGWQDAAYTDEIASETSSTNANGLLYDTLYLKVFTNGTFEGISGPLYAFDIPFPADGTGRILTMIPGETTFDSCFTASSSRPESPAIRAFVENVSAR